MKKSTTTIVLLLSVLTVLGISMLNSCKKDVLKPFYLFIENPFPFDIQIVGTLKDCDFGDEPCIYYPGKIYEGKTPGHSGTIFAKNVATGDLVGSVNYESNMQGGYSWKVGLNNPLVKIESDGGSDGGGNNNNGNNNDGNDGGNDSGNGSLTVFQNDPATAPTRIEILGPNAFISEKKAITKYYKQVECGQSGCANFSLPPGNYYIEAYHKSGGLELGYGPIGPFKIEAGKCTIFRMDNFF